MAQYNYYTSLFCDNLFTLFLNKFIYYCGKCSRLCFFWGDCAEPFQITFQDPATTSMEGIYLFNLHLIFVITSIVLIVSWLLTLILKNFLEFNSSKASNFTHSNEIEIVWTTVPAIILLSLAFPSFSLLYSMDEVSPADLSLKILGHQWYWSYEISDFDSCAITPKNLKFSSYMLSDESLKDSYIGLLRNLETNRRLLLPTNTHIRLLITSVDVLHSWAVPSFGIKVDACPGRLNQANLFIKRFGVFFGQCSEICGVNHGFMPVSVVSTVSDQYYEIVSSVLKRNIKVAECATTVVTMQKDFLHGYYGELCVDLMDYNCGIDFSDINKLNIEDAKKIIDCFSYLRSMGARIDKNQCEQMLEFFVANRYWELLEENEELKQIIEQKRSSCKECHETRLTLHCMKCLSSLKAEKAAMAKRKG
jgi:cytochrome c oxidase subunit 2